MSNRLYHKEILSSNALQLGSSDIPPFPFAGLHAIMRHPNMEFGNFDISDEMNWLDVAQVTFYQAILHATCTDSLSVTNVLKRTSILFNLIRYKSLHYAFERIDHDLNQDLFSELILNAAASASRRPSSKNQIYTLVREVVNKFLGKHTEHNFPAKQFVLRLIQAYDTPEDWFELKVQKKFLGLVKNYKLNMDEEKFQEIVEYHMDFGVYVAKYERENSQLLLFKKDLFEAIQRDFRGREPRHAYSD